MGTSSGYSLPKTGNWPEAKREVTVWGGSGTSTPSQMGRVMGDYVQAHGGAGTIAQQSTTANQAGARFGGLLSGIRGEGLGSTLENAGLGHLVGRAASEVWQGIKNYLIGDGSNLEDGLVRGAFDEFQEEIIGQHETYEELDAAFTRIAVVDTISENMERLFGHFVYKKFKRDFSERLLRAAGGPKQTKRLLRDIKDFIFDTIRTKLHGRDFDKINWKGRDGLQMAEEIHASVWRVFGET
jgi:hypothetical protein